MQPACWRDPKAALKVPDQVAVIAEPDLMGNFGDTEGFKSKQMFGAIQAPVDHVLMGSFARRNEESTAELGDA